CTRAQVSKFASSRRIIFLELGRVALPPGLQLCSIFRRKINEANSELATGIFPCDLADTGYGVLGSRQQEMHRHRVRVAWPLWKLDGDAAFAEINGRRVLLAGTIVEAESHWNFDRDASIAAAFALHQGASGTKAGLRALAGHRFVENEMR